MSVIEKLTPNRKKFFEELGILKDEDLPKSFFEKIESYEGNFGVGEQFCLNDYYIAFCKKATFSIKDVVGTNHQRYENKTWLEAFMDLDRGEEILELYFRNPKYYDDLKDPQNCDMGFAYKDGKYYIFDHAGGGNNRMIIMKIKYLALLNKENCDIEKLNSQFSYVGNVRVSPSKETADNIFYYMFPDGGYVDSGYYVLNKSTSLDKPVYDIVTDFPFHTEIVHSGLDEEKLNDVIQNIDKKRKL